MTPRLRRGAPSPLTPATRRAAPRFFGDRLRARLPFRAARPDTAPSSAVHSARRTGSFTLRPLPVAARLIARITALVGPLRAPTVRRARWNRPFTLRPLLVAARLIARVIALVGPLRAPAVRRARWNRPFTPRPLLVAALLIALCAPSRADPAAEVLDTYRAFAAAQNARDPARIGAFFIDEPTLLWVSDGAAYWGREAILARMGSFQKAPVWRVEPALDRACATPLSPDTELLHMELTLVIGDVANPSRLPFLVSLVFVRREGGWRIAALLTTTTKGPQPSCPTA